MKKVLISSFDMEIGGVERSLINMLENFDYDNNEVDLMLYKHQGEFMKLLPNRHTLLDEISEYASFRTGIIDLIREGKLNLAIKRLNAKIDAKRITRQNNLNDSGHIQMQLMWKYSLKYLPKIEKEYDVAISYLWPHYFVAEKVNAKKKIAWIHTDYSTIETDVDIDLEMWNKFDNIISISDECTKAFLSKYPSLEKKIVLVENITSPKFITKMSVEEPDILFKSEKCFKIVSVGRLSYQKGFDNAIKAFSKIIDRNISDIKWYIVGYGGDEHSLKELIKKNNLGDYFILLGKKTNPYPYILNCDLYVQPSRYEGKAVTVTEAKILGKPVMITNYATARSQVKHNVDGYITELSVDGIANGIEYLYKNKKTLDNYTDYCKNKDYSNKDELEKLYQLF